MNFIWSTISIKHYCIHKDCIFLYLHLSFLLICLNINIYRSFCSKYLELNICIYAYSHNSNIHVIPALFAEQICFTPRSSSRTERLSPPQFFSSDCFKGTTICKSVWGRQNTSPYPLTVLLENFLLFDFQVHKHSKISYSFGFFNRYYFLKSGGHLKRASKKKTKKPLMAVKHRSIHAKDGRLHNCNSALFSKSWGWIISPLRQNARIVCD